MKNTTEIHGKDENGLKILNRKSETAVDKIKGFEKLERGQLSDINHCKQTGEAD